MAIRQYIGARYVPKYDGTFDSAKSYEPLTIVDDANGNSYTSKIPVPSGSSLDDRTYWAPSGSFSGAVQQLQSRMDVAENDITNLKSDVTSLERDITNLEKDVELGEVLFISDSYGQTQDSEGKTAFDRFVIATGLTARQYSRGGASFKTGTLLEGLMEYTTPDDSKIKTIIIYCGANDQWGTHEAIVTGITNMINYIKSRFVNVKKIALCCCGLTMTSQNGGARTRETVIRAYVYGAYVNGCIYIQNSESTLHNTAFLKSDGTHPNDYGVSLLTKMLVAAYHGDSFTIHERMSVSMTKAGNAPENLSLVTGTIDIMIDNDTLTLQGRNPQKGVLAFTSGAGTIEFNGATLIDFVDLSESVISTLSNDNDGTFMIHGNLHIYGESTPWPGVIYAYIEDKVLKGYLITKANPATNITITGFTSTDSTISVPVNRY